MTGAARLAPGSLREVGPLIWTIAKLAGKVSRTEPPAVFLTLGRNRRLFWGWLHFAGTMMPGGRLPRRETELVILRVAAVSGSDYEWQQHAGLGQRAGLSPAEVEAVGRLALRNDARTNDARTNDVEGGSAHRWSTRDRLLLDVTDELLDSQDLSEETWARLRDVLDERTSVELLMLVGHYRMLATTLRALRVQPDRRME